MDDVTSYDVQTAEKAPYDLFNRPRSCVGCKHHNVKQTYGGFAVDKCTRGKAPVLVEFPLKSTGHCGPARRNYTK